MANDFPKRRPPRVVFGTDLEYVPREDRNWTPETPIKRFRIAGQARVTATSLRLRKTPETGDTVTAIPKDAIVSLGPSDTAGWAYVEWNGFYGFASNQYLEPVGGPDWDPKPIPPPPAPAPQRYVPPAPPAPPPPQPSGPTLAQKVFAAALVLTVLGVPTYFLLKKPSYA